MREKDKMRELDSNNLTTYKKEEDNTDEFSMNEDDATGEWNQEHGSRTPCGECRTVYTYVVGKECDEESIDLEWKIEAVRGYVQKENEEMNGWLKNINSDRFNAFKTALIDLS